MSVDLPTSLTESPSVTTFLPEEDASTCPLLPNTPSPPPLAFSHPLTPSVDNESNDSVNCEDTKAETSSSGSSSGIAMDAPDAAATSLFNKHAYHHLGKNGDIAIQENGLKQSGLLNIPITKDTPSFVSWNWPLIRKCTFFLFMSSLLAMCALVVAMIIMLPKTCNPRISWFKGSVFYEIFPASFQDSGNDGLGDLRGIASRAEYFQSIGVGAIRLNSIFPSQHYPDQYENISTLTAIDKTLGNEADFMHMVNILHMRNVSIVLDLPIYPYLNQLGIAEIVNVSLTNETITTTKSSLESSNVITQAMRYWLARGVDGFYVKGLEHFIDDPNFEDNIAEWKYVLGSDRVLMINKKVLEKMDKFSAAQIMKYIDLVEVFLDISNGTQAVFEEITATLSSSLAPELSGPWIQWTLGGVGEQRMSRDASPNVTLAANLMQLTLPGTPSIFYGDEISLQESHDPHNEHSETKHMHHLSAMMWNGTQQFTNRETLPWLPQGASASMHHLELISEMINLRDRSPSIYQNAIAKEAKTTSNTNVQYRPENILIIERWYPRRNSFVAITNFGKESVTMDLTTFFYSGKTVLGGMEDEEKVYFNNFEIGPLKTVIVKLDK